MFNTPVLLIVFNRPDSTKLVLGVLESVKPQKFFIACDGPRIDRISDIELVKEVRTLCDNIGWKCEIERLYHDSNLGCSNGPRSAINWFFSHVEAGIILEDDCLPCPSFFKYCGTLLEYFKNDNQVLNICGSNMGYNKVDTSGYFFSRFMNMSGWATWRRSVIEIDYELKSWNKVRYPFWKSYKMLRQSFFDTDVNWYRYWRDKFDKTITIEHVSWWDWQWIYYQLSTKKLSVIPNQNLVSNIGFNASATHTKDPDNPLANLPTGTLTFPLKHLEYKKPDFGYEEYAVKWVWCYHKRQSLFHYIKYKMLSKFRCHYF